MQSATLHLLGIDCAACALAIESVLDRVAGVQDAEVDARAHTLQVSYDPAVVTLETISQAVHDAGFDIEESS